MKHRVKGKKLNRNTNQRQALFKSLIRSLVLEGEIVTTYAKAKSIQGTVDKLITKARQNTLASRRDIQAFFNQKQVTNRLVDHLTPQFTSRTSGYTRLVRLDRRRGDNTLTVKLSFTDPLTPPKLATSPAKKVPTKPAKSAQTNTKKTSKTKSSSSKSKSTK